MSQYIFIGMVIIGVITLVISFCTHKMEVFLSYILRVAFAVASIYVVNMVIGMLGYHLVVGLNGGNVLTVTVLGTPGLVALYLLVAYFRYI
ncbi:hypothetical protein lbkm_3268 [Lachnospiraceae bacterium KM106-2]|nr:hypothetical protein lbkm_3268 [Lachnospiraceae bacterium KM106-2]